MRLRKEQTLVPSQRQRHDLRTHSLLPMDLVMLLQDWGLELDPGAGTTPPASRPGLGSLWTLVTGVPAS